MKITLVIEEWRQSTKGGRSTLMRQMAIELSRLEKVEVCILIPSASPEDKKDAQRYNIKVFESEKYPGYEPVDCLQFPQQGFSTDVIICYGIKPGCHGQVLKKCLGCKWVHVVLRNAGETVLFQTADSAISKGQKQNETEVELCKHADMVVPVGSELYETFKSALHHCKKDRIFNLTPGIFNETFGVQKQYRASKNFEMSVFGRGNTEDFEHTITQNSGLTEALEEVPLGHACIVDQEADWVVQIKRAPKHLRTRLEEASMLRNMYEEKYCWRDQCAAFVKRLMALHSG